MSYGTASPGLVGRLLGAFGYHKALPPPGALYAAQAQASPTFAPLNFPGWAEYEKQVPNQSADEGRARTAVASSWVYACVSAIANEASVARLVVKERGGDEGEQDIENHPLELLWEAPNPFMGRSFLVSFWVWQRLLFGKSFLYWVSGPDGEIAEVWPVPATMLHPIPDEKTFIGGYWFKARPDARPIKIDAKFITYSRIVHPFDVRDGLSPLAAAFVDVEAEIAMAKWNRSFFAKENATPEGMITVAKDMLDPDIARVRQEIADFFGGGTRRVAVARAGDMDWKPFGRTQKDMEFLSGRTYSGEAIMRVFGIPAGYFAKDATRANSEGAKATMIENAVWPHLVALAEDLNAQTLPHHWGDDLRVMFDDIRPRNRVLELDEFKTYMAVKTVNELRASIDLPELEEDDKRGPLFVKEIEMGAAAPDAEAEEAVDPESLPPAELPEDDAGDVPPEIAEPAAAAPADAPTKALDLRRWQTKALKALKDGRRPAVRFVSDAIPPEEARAITDALTGAQTPADVRAAFGEALRGGPFALKRADDALPQALAAALAQAGANPDAVDMAALQRALVQALTPALTTRYAATAVDVAVRLGVPMDPAEAAALAQEWAASYVPGAVSGMTETTEAALRAALATARQTPGLTLGALAETLAPVFGADRADLIATTELTRAAAQATAASQTYLAGRGVATRQVWRSANDERACPVCGPRNGQPQGDGWDEPPPAHPRCRCFVTLDLVRHA